MPVRRKGKKMLILGGSGGGGGYHADAVHFDGSTYISTGSLTAANNAFFSFSFWTKAEDNADIVYVSDPSGSYNNYGEIATGAFPDSVTNFFLGDGTSQLLTATDNYDESLWTHFIGSFDVGHDGNNKVGVIYINDVFHVSGGSGGSGPAFNLAFNALPFFLGDDGFGDPFIGDMADVRIMPGVSLLDGGGDIPLATRRLFIDGSGKPVDPSVATATLGAPGAILFSGNASTFATNQGTGGIFTTTGTLTNASTSPSD